MGDSMPSVYRRFLLLDARGQGRRNERRPRFCAHAAVQPSAVRERGERQRVPNSSSQTDAMAYQPRQPAGFLKTCNTDGSVFSRSRQKQHIEKCTVLKNRRFHEVGKLYRRSATVSRMTGYFLIVERICYVAITAIDVMYYENGGILLTVMRRLMKA